MTIGLLLLGAVAWRRYGFENRVQVAAPSVLEEPAGVVDLWFHDRHLLALEVVDSTAVLWRWTSDSLRLVDRRAGNLNRLARASTTPVRRIETLRRSRTVAAVLPPRPSGTAYLAAAKSSIPDLPPEDRWWAVSRDGASLAWLATDPYRVVVAAIGDSAADGNAVITPTDSAAFDGKERGQLGFTRSGAIGVYQRTGRLDVRQAAGGWAAVQVPGGMRFRIADDRFLLIGRPDQEAGTLGVLVVDPAQLVRRGPDQPDSLGVSSRSMPDVERQVVQAAPSRRNAYPTAFQEPVAISPAGRIAIGTSDGNIVRIDSTLTGGVADTTLAAPGVSTALSFLDEERLLVAGGFRGIHLLAPGRAAEQIVDAPIGTSLLAMAGDRLAFSTGRAVSVATVTEVRAPTDLGKAILAAMLLVGLAGSGLAMRPVAATPASPQTVVVRKVGARPGREDPPEPPPPPPPGLIDALRRGNCLLITGHGLGVQAGLPLWDEFVAGLAESTARTGVLAPDAKEAIDEALANDNVTSAAEELSRTIPAGTFREYVTAVFGPATPAPVHTTLGQLPFAGAITTNYDRLLLDAFSHRQPRAVTSADSAEIGAGLLDAVRERQFFLLNLLGRVDRPETLVFTSRAYRDILANDLPLKQLVRSLFERYSVLFVGMSLASIRDFLDAIEVGASKQAEARHFALAGQSRRLEAAEVRTLRDRYQIEVLGFVPSPGWPELDGFLQPLAAETAAPGAAQVAAAERPRITRLRLENIGPFEVLDLTLAPHWNVILGDNGVGKTVALRAISTALLGRDVPSDSAARLLRTGADVTSGKIEVYGIGPSPYTMEFRRDLGGRPQVESAMVSPLRLSKWLVIAFPALRTIPFEARPARYDDSRRQSPIEADLASMAANVPDTRSSDLRSWLRSLDNRIRQGRGHDRERAVMLKNRFGQIVAALTPGANLEYVGTDPDAAEEAAEIRIKADGRLVPLEYVSQGTASVLCWVGVLLQRMYEVHHELEHPEDGPTLVLIDEIDAHMHPAWQRQLAPTLREQLPNLQVLATTHSPMIVGSMQEEELFLARRHEGRALIERSRLDPASLRVDQLLTSPLFSLESPHANLLVAEAHELYVELASRLPESLTPEEKEQLERAEALLAKIKLSPQDRFVAVQAYEVMAQSFEGGLAKLPEAQRERVAQEIKVQMAEATARQREQSAS